MRFFVEHIKALLAAGHSVDLACNNHIRQIPEEYGGMACGQQTICWTRQPFDLKNIRAVGQLKKVVSKGGYEIVHCHTPVAAACARLACAPLRRRGLKVVYTAHGFHFFEGAPLKNWLIYYPIEWICSWMTDAIITITHEDYDRAKHHLHARNTFYVPGVGVDFDRFSHGSGAGIRENLDIPKKATVVVSVGELNDNKNHQIVLRALQLLDVNAHYVIAGAGPKMNEIGKLAEELGLSQRVHLLGMRDDIPALLAASDVFVLPSLREGLNVSLMEAMASGLPCVCRRIRGNVDLVDDGKGGVLVDDEKPECWAKAIQEALAIDRMALAKHNMSKVAGFSRTNVERKLAELLANIASWR